MIRIVLFILCLTCTCLTAQQDNQYTQFGYTPMYYNPGYAGIDEQLSLIARHRTQWTGLQGSPTGQSLLVNFPSVIDVLGFGLSINRNTIGISEKNDITGMYAYKLKIDKASVSLGLQLSMRQFINDFTREELIPIDGFEIDPSIAREKYTNNIFNVGAGLYAKAPRYYIGISVPRLVKGDLDSESINEISREARHLYGQLGLNFNLNLLWKMEQHTLIKLAENVPLDIDLQANFIYEDQVYLGFNYRAGGSQQSIMESLSFLLGFKFTPSIFASMSYDFSTTALRNYENGSFEILLKYQLQKDTKPKSIQNPRYY